MVAQDEAPDLTEAKSKRWLKRCIAIEVSHAFGCSAFTFERLDMPVVAAVIFCDLLPCPDILFGNADVVKFQQVRAVRVA